MNSRSKINRRIPAGHTKQLKYDRLEKRQLLAADTAGQPIELVPHGMPNTVVEPDAIVAVDSIFNGSSFAPSFITALETDDFGNDAGSARSLSFPFDVAGSIDALGDEDWFRFNAVAGWNYEFEIAFDALTASQLSIYATDGTPLEQTNAPTVSWVAPQSGTYYLSVEDSFGSDISDYQLSGFVPESTVEFNAPTFGAPGPVGFDLYDATGFAAGATVAIESSSGDIEILPVTAAAGFDFSASIDSVEGLASPNDGTLQVSSGDTLTATYLDSQNGNGGSFTSIDTVTIFADEHGNDFESSTALNFPFNLSERIETSGDVDWFSFDAIEGLQYDFEVGFASFADFELRLHGSDGLTQLESINSTAAIISWIAPESGTYFLSFDGAVTGSTGSYQLLGSSTVPNSSIDFSADGYYLPNVVEFTVTDATGFASGATVLVESSSGDTETFLIDSEGIDFSFSIDSELSAANPNDGLFQVASGDILTATYFDSDDGLGSTFTAINSVRVFVDDHGEDALAATLLDLPASISGSIEIAGDRDWFSFSATAGETYQFAIPADDVGTVLGVYSNDGIRLLRRDSSVDPLINWVAPSDGVYYLSVRSFASNEIGNYELTAKAIIDDQHGNDAATATPLELPADIAASIGVAGEQDWFSFDATAGELYRFQVPAADQSTELTLYNTNGTTQLRQITSNSATLWLAPNDGTYFLSVAGRFSDEIGNYELTVELFPDDYGDDASTATGLDLPASVSGSIEVAMDQDWFSFIASAGEAYRFEIPTHDESTELTLYGADGTTQLEKDGGSFPAFTWVARSSGTYFLSVESFGSDDIGDYELTAEIVADDHGDDPTEATFISLPASVSGSSESPGDQDWFSFSATAGTIYEFAVPVSDEISHLFLYSSDGATLLDDDFSNPSLLWNAPSDGVYYLSVEFFSSPAAGNYQLTVKVIADDHGDSALTATAVTFPASISGSIEGEGDQDWFSFDATAGTTYRFEIPSSNSHTKLRIYDTDGATLLARGSAFRRTVFWIAPTDETYFVALEGRSSSGLGAFDVSTTSYLDSHGNGFATATSLNLSTTVSSAIETTRDQDWFSFNTVAGETYRLAIPSHDEPVALTLYDTDGTTQLERSITAIPTITWVALSSGTYYFSVRPNSSNVIFAYELSAKLITDDHGNSPTTATSISLPASISASIGLVGDQDWFSFNTVAGESYRISIPAFSFSTVMDLTIYDTDGITQLARDIGFPATITWVAPSDGLYYFSINDGNNNEFTDYEFSAAVLTDDHSGVPASATPLSIPATVSGSLELTGDQDWFSFTAAVGENFRFAIPTADKFTELTLYDTDGATQLANESMASPEILWAAPSSGTYYLSVADYRDDDYGDYELSAEVLSDDHGSGPASASPLSVPSNVFGSLETPGDLDWFSFSATAGAKIDIAIPANDEFLVITLYDTDGTTQLEQGSFFTPGIFWIAPNSGTFYLSVEAGNRTFFGDYELSVAARPDDDHKDVPAAATPLPLHASVVGTIEVAGDKDFFSFEAVAGLAYDFELTWDGPEFGALSLIDTDGSTVLLRDAVRPRFSWDALESGTYFLVAAGFVTSSLGDYELSATSKLQATTISFDAESYLIPNLNASPLSQVTVDLLDGNGFVPGATITIETSSGDSETVVVTSNGVTFTTSLVTVEGLASPNDGTLQVTSGDQIVAAYFDPDYGLAGKFFRETVDVFVDDRGDSPATASFVDFPASISGEIELSGDRDWFRFSARAGLEYTFEANLGSSLTSVLALYDTDGVSLLLSDVSSTRAEISWLAQESGQYYLVVGDLPNTRFNRTGTYQLTGTTSGPVIEDVIVGSTQFADDFIDVIGDNGLGYSIVGAHQRDALPWANIDTFYLQFSEDVSGSLSAAGVQVVGTHGGTYDVEFVGYDTGSNTAEFRINNDISSDSLVISIFDGAVTNAAGGVLDGEWTSDQVGASGDGVSGGRFDFFFNILVGDEDGSDEVNVDDAIGIFSSDTQTVNLTNFRRDIDGSGQIDSVDALAAFANNASGLVASPTAPAPNAGVTVVLLGDVGQNGSTNFLDISPFISLLSTGDFQEEADINRDGLVNFLDISPFINLLSSGGSNSQFAVSQVSTSPLAPSLPASEAVAVQSIASSRSSRQISDGISVELVESPSNLSLVPTEAVAFEPNASVDETSQQPSETVGAQLSGLPTEPSQVLADKTNIEVVSTPSSFSLATSTVEVAGLTASSPERSLLAAIGENAVSGLVDSVKLQSTIPIRAEQSTVLAGSRANDSDDQVVSLLTDDLELVVLESAGEQFDVDQDLFEGLTDNQLDETFAELASSLDY